VVGLLAVASAFVPSASSSGIWDRKGMEPYRLPLDRVWLMRAALARPHHNHPSSDLYVPSGTRVYAAQAGRVRAVLSNASCGLGIVIDGADGFRYTYCHGSASLVSTGRYVHAGDPIMRSGNSGSSGAPHLHFEIEDAQLRLKCPQPLLLSWWQGGQKTPRDAPYGGCSY
jgi:murein DD-endopeptidase MepM/ murein hydrolase activator NlpD